MFYNIFLEEIYCSDPNRSLDFVFLTVKNVDMISETTAERSNDRLGFKQDKARKNCCFCNKKRGCAE